MECREAAPGQPVEPGPTTGPTSTTTTRQPSEEEILAAIEAEAEAVEKTLPAPAGKRRKRKPKPGPKAEKGKAKAKMTVGRLPRQNGRLPGIGSPVFSPAGSPVQPTAPTAPAAQPAHPTHPTHQAHPTQVGSPVGSPVGAPAYAMTPAVPGPNAPPPMSVLDRLNRSAGVAGMAAMASAGVGGGRSESMNHDGGPDDDLDEDEIGMFRPVDGRHESAGEDDDEDESDDECGSLDKDESGDDLDDEMPPVTLFRSSSGVVRNPTVPAKSEPAMPTGPASGSVEDRMAFLEQQNAMLMKRLEELPAHMNQVLANIAASQGGRHPGAPGAPGAPGGGGHNGGGGGMGATLPIPAPGGGGAVMNLLNMLPQLMHFGKQLGVFGEDKPAQNAAQANAMASTFIDQMAQFLQIQNAMESLQMNKLNNQTLWLARMFKIFGKEGFERMVSLEEGAMPAFEALSIPRGGGSAGAGAAPAAGGSGDDD